MPFARKGDEISGRRDWEKRPMCVSLPPRRFNLPENRKCFGWSDSDKRDNWHAVSHGRTDKVITLFPQFVDIAVVHSERSAYTFRKDTENLVLPEHVVGIL